MKRAFLSLLATILSLSLALPVFAAEPDYKIAIMTGAPGSQGREEYFAALKLKEQYPGIVITETYSQGVGQEVQTNIDKLLAIAKDPQVKAIIVCQAIQGTSDAFTQIKNDLGRDDILLIAGVPAEDPRSITAVADIVMDVDDIGGASQIVQTAQGWGAEVLVYYSFPPRVGGENDTAVLDIINEETQSAGIVPVYPQAPQPNGDAGASEARNIFPEDLSKVMQEYAGKKVAFFCSNCSIQDAQSVAEQLSEIALTAPVSVWFTPIYSPIINCGFEYASKYINGEIGSRSDGFAIIKLLESISGSDVGLSNYEDGDGKVYGNYFMLQFDYVEIK